MPDNKYLRVAEWSELAETHESIKAALQDAQTMIEALRIELKDAWAEVARLKRTLEESHG